jgi:hypothetical protein
MLKRVFVGALSAALLVAPLVTVAANASQDAGGGSNGQQGQDEGRTVECKNQTFGAVRIDANIRVPAGAFCDLNGTHVTGHATVSPGQDLNPAGLALDLGAVIDGSVKVSHNAEFVAFNSSAVGGDVLCNRCHFADVHDSTVHGDLISNGLTQGAFEQNSQFRGNLVIRNSSDGGFGFTISSNTVGDNLSFNNNTGASSITNNTVGERLECNGNTPPPVGGGNTAQQKTGQCALL